MTEQPVQTRPVRPCGIAVDRIGAKSAATRNRPGVKTQGKVSLVDVAMECGIAAIQQRIADLRSDGHYTAALCIERELAQLRPDSMP
ncbi:hypothetical protein [Nocardia sp. NPDC051463]|uniref:hypothetical protein n=1 Tax=Nocardia sp. NPDC051463 TaxID=3154845 RepID=UPI0034159D0A